MVSATELRGFKDRTVIGLSEIITIKGSDESTKIKARIDTGATLSSMDLRLAAELGLGPVTRTKFVRSAQGSKVKPVIKASIEIEGRKISASFTLSDRKHMTYRVLIGQNVLKMGFLIDPQRNPTKTRKSLD